MHTPRDGSWKELRALAARAAAASSSTVLVLAGHGAPVLELAREVHALSPRAGRSFRAVRCALVPALDAAGELEAAGDGTLLLEQVERLATEIQGRLAARLALRRERGEAGARVIASVAEAPDALVESGRLREDLLYRINGVTLELPSLASRPGDALALARDALARLAPQASFTRAAERRLEEHDWPGNEREVELVVERAALVARSAWIDERDLGLGTPPAVPTGPAFSTDERSVRAVEEALIRRVLEEQGGNRSAAARVLGLHRATLHLKLRAMGLGPR